MIEMSDTNGSLFDGVMSSEDAKKEKKAAYMREYSQKNKERLKQYMHIYNKQYREANRERLAEKRLEKRDERNRMTREWYAANNDHVVAYRKKYLEENRERVNQHKREFYQQNREDQIAKVVKYQEENKEKLEQYRQNRYAENREFFIEQSRKYKQDNPDIAKGWRRTRRARLKNAEGSHTPEDVNNLFVLQKGKCACCLKSIKKGYQVDHIVALSKGGSNDKYNLQLLCAPCNSFKRAKDPIEHNQSLGLLL